MKNTILAILISSAMIIFALMFIAKPKTTTQEIVDNVKMENGNQIITIKVKGGYSPKISNAKAGIPTIIRMETNGSFDCSSSLVIPDINYRAFLPNTGKTDIKINESKVGPLRGMCSMGMYNFVINFQ